MVFNIYIDFFQFTELQQTQPSESSKQEEEQAKPTRLVYVLQSIPLFPQRIDITTAKRNAAL